MKKTNGFRKLLAMLLVLCLVTVCEAGVLADNIKVTIDETTAVEPDPQTGVYVAGDVNTVDISSAQGDAGEVSVTVGNVSGDETVSGNSALDISNLSDKVSIDVTVQGIETNEGTAEGIHGIEANNNQGSIDLHTGRIVTNGRLSDGVHLENNVGSISLDSQEKGDPAGIDAKANGVNIYSNENQIELSTGTVNAGNMGIYYNGSGENAVAEFHTGAISAKNTGVRINNNYGSVDLNTGENDTPADISGSNGIDVDWNHDETNIRAKNVTGNKDAINIGQNDENGEIDISATAVKSTKTAGIRIGAYYSGNTGSITLTADSVSGGEDGIYIVNNGYMTTGKGSITLNTGDVTGSGNNGIYITNNNGTINQNQGENAAPGNVTGMNNGINIVSSSGTINLTENNVTGTNGDGILVGETGDKYKNTGVISINANNVTGGNNGVNIVNNGDSSTNKGSVTINAGDVSGGNGAGIAVNNSGELSVLCDSVSSKEGSGISVAQAAVGSTTNITVMGDVNGTVPENTSAGLTITGIDKDAKVDIFVDGTIHRGETDNALRSIEIIDPGQNGTDNLEGLTITAWSIDVDQEGKISGCDDDLKDNVNYILRVDAIDAAVGAVIDTISSLFSFNIGGLAFEKTGVTVGQEEKKYATAKEGEQARLSVAVDDVFKVGEDEYQVVGIKTVEGNDSKSDAQSDQNGYYFDETVQKGGGWWLRVLLNKIAKTVSADEPADETKDESQSQTDPETGSESESDSNTQPQTRSDSETDSESESDTQFQSKSDLKTGPESAPKFSIVEDHPEPRVPPRPVRSSDNSYTKSKEKTDTSNTMDYSTIDPSRSGHVLTAEEIAYLYKYAGFYAEKCCPQYYTGNRRTKFINFFIYIFRNCLNNYNGETLEELLQKATDASELYIEEFY